MTAPGDVLQLMARASGGNSATTHGVGRIADALEAAEKAGWKLVPATPTPEMLRAAGASPDGVSPRGGIDRLGRMLPKYWAAMVTAAPKVCE